VSDVADEPEPSDLSSAANPGSAATSDRHPAESHRPTRVSAAWVAVAVSLVLLLLLLVFILQNSHRASVHFLWLEGSVPIGVALFAASILGGGLVAIAGASRIVQLRRSARRIRKRRAVSS
jgi:uncharacterized integral membrane protein